MFCLFYFVFYLLVNGSHFSDRLTSPAHNDLFLAYFR